VDSSSGTLGLGRVAQQTLLGGLRRPPSPWTVEVVVRESGRLVAVEPVNGSRGQAEGLFHVMRADLEAMDARRFLRRWGRRPR
jgi:hypothetical protein